MVDFSALGDVSAEVLSMHCHHVSMNSLVTIKHRVAFKKEEY